MAKRAKGHGSKGSRTKWPMTKSAKVQKGKRGKGPKEPWAKRVNRAKRAKGPKESRVKSQRDQGYKEPEGPK